MRFRLLIAFMAAIFVGYSIYWYVVAQAARSDIAAWIAAQKQAGHDISYSALDVGGYPYRIEVQVKDAGLKGVNGAVSWQLASPHFAFVSLPWQPEHKVLFADHLTLDMTEPGAESQHFIAEKMRGSLVADAFENPLRVSLTADSLTVAAPPGAPSAPPSGKTTTSTEADAPIVQIVPIAKGIVIRDMQLHWRAAAEAVREKGETEDSGIREPLAWQIAFKSKGVHYPDYADGPYGADIQDLSLVFEMRGAGYAPGVPARAVAAWRDHGGTLELTSGSMQWGKLDAKLNGSVTLDQQFRPLGAFTAFVKGYDPLLDHLLKSGGIDHQDAQTVRSMLDQIIAADTDDDGRLRLPLTMQGGLLTLGPLPLAELKPVM